MINIVLDYGHGQGTEHKRGFINGNEGDNNFYFGKKLKNEIEKYQNVKVYETRPEIQLNPILRTRARKFLDKNADLYISIHSNAGGGTGSEVYDRKLVSERNDRQTLPIKLSKVCSEVLGIRDRGLKFYPFAVIGNGNNAKIKCLLEMFFHDNKSDVQKFNENEERLAIELAKAIAEYFKLKKINQDATDKKESTGGRTLYKVQVGAFTVKSNADNLLKELKNKGYSDAYITTSTIRKSLTEVAKDVINGDYGNGQARKDKLKAEGYDYDLVQAEVNKLL